MDMKSACLLPRRQLVLYCRVICALHGINITYLTSASGSMDLESIFIWPSVVGDVQSRSSMLSLQLVCWILNAAELE